MIEVKSMDEVCPHCYHAPTTVVKRIEVIRKYEKEPIWMLIRECPKCGWRTMRKDPNQEAGNEAQ